MRMIFSALFFFCFTVSAEVQNYNTVKSLYLDSMLVAAKKSSMETTTFNSPPISLDCFQTPGNELYIGVKQVMDVNANYKKLDAILNDFEHYHELFPGLKKTQVLMREGNKILTAWETIVPVPFVPNVKYEMVYLLESPTPDQRLYRYHLHEVGAFKASDGFILIKKINENLTRYIEYDFYDAEWGAAKIMGNKRLWFESIEGIAHSDLALKFKAENMDWTNARAKKEAGWALKSEKIDDRINHCIRNKKLL